ncbi:MAG: hypothetical protein JSW26_05280 [Desulfobacterales bacterium]|nr:MAG: hypothetical protein JSW26_05280 [Desulfobacterales bacterium]
MNIKKLRLENILVGCFSVLLATWMLAYSSNLQAGQTYYYDLKGNLISAEEYEKLLKKLKEKKNTTDTPSEASDSGSQVNAQDDTGHVELSTEAANSGEENSAEESTNEENEDEDNEAQYRVEVSSETFIRAFRRDTDSENDSLVLAGYEYLRMDLGALDQEGLSFHFYGWGRYDFNHSGFYDDNPDADLLYGYLEYNQPDYGLNIKLGRQHLMTGIINNSIDGIGLQSALTPHFKFSVFGGSPVGLSSEPGRSGDGIYGGRVAGHQGAEYEIGVSYKKKYSDSEKDEELAGLDIVAALPFKINFIGSSSYNLDTKGWGAHSYEIRFDISNLYFRPFYERYRYEDYFNTKDNSANPFRLLADTGEILSILGSEVIWRRFSRVDLGAKVNYFDYDLREDPALYVEGNASWYMTDQTQIGGQLGRMNGDTNATRYLMTRAFFYWDMPANLSRLGSITGDAIYVLYDENIYGHDSSLWISLGGGWRFLDDALQVKLSGDWSNDPYFESDLRGLLKIEYNY